MNQLQQFPDYIYQYPECRTCEQTLQILQIHIERNVGNELEFDIIGLKPFVVNAIRQTILNDIPTMAIEDVYFYKNSSMFNCDYISQRLALVPIKADPDLFKMCNPSMPKLNSDNAIIFKLQACNDASTEPIKVYSNSLIWEPVGERQKSFNTKITPLHGNIPLLYLKPNEEISCTIHCIKGIGRSHMKYCPGFARYCFHSKIDFKQTNFTPELAHQLQCSFPAGVIELCRLPNGQFSPVVANARLDRHSRSFQNNPNVKQAVEVKYYRDHLIFTVESYGVLSPTKMVLNALKILKYKYNFWRNHIEQVKKRHQPSPVVVEEEKEKEKKEVGS